MRSSRNYELADIVYIFFSKDEAGIKFYDWDKTAQKKIILIGDAEPHPAPRGLGKCSKEVVMELAKKEAVTINAIITPDEKSRRGR